MILGLLAGLAVWPLAEFTLLYQVQFPSYLTFMIFQGAIFGLIMGGFFGSSEGLISQLKSRIFKGILAGAIIGLVGGVIGFLIGQLMLQIVGGLFISSYRNFTWIGLPLSRAIGWAFLGIFIGMIDGVRSFSPKKILIGFLGGLVGGLVGGFFIEYSKLLLPNFFLFRLVGLMLFGFSIGFFYSLIEQGMSAGVLQVLNGRLKGKEILINQNKLKMGKTKKNDVILIAYSKIANEQAVFKTRAHEVNLVNLSPEVPILVNEEAIKEKKLKFGDVIKMGSVKLYYKFE
jgi:MFS family permease